MKKNKISIILGWILYGIILVVITVINLINFVIKSIVDEANNSPYNKL